MEKMKYTEKLGNDFITWNAAQNVKGTDGKVKRQEWHDEESKIRWCLIVTKTSKRSYALKEYPERWKEFCEMKRRKSEARA